MNVPTVPPKLLWISPAYLADYSTWVEIYSCGSDRDMVVHTSKHVKLPWATDSCHESPSGTQMLEAHDVNVISFVMIVVCKICTK